MTQHLKSTLLDIWDGVRAQPGRVGLSFMAIVVGITALTVLVAVLGGLQERSQRMVQEFGANVLAIVQGEPGEGGAQRRVLKKEHVALLIENLEGCIVAGMRAYDVPTHGSDKRLQVIATDEQLLDVRRWRMAAGRFLDRDDVAHLERHAVVSSTLSRLWNWNVGDEITLQSVPFKVVGVVEVGGGALETETAEEVLVLGERVVFVPGSIPPYWSSRPSIRPSDLNAIFVRVSDASAFERVIGQAQRILGQPDVGAAGLSWITPETLLERIRGLQTTIKLTVGSIAMLCLVLGGTTLMSLMVVNVRDRVGEIGLRRALGATPRDIAALFLLEACLVTTAAGLTGTLATHALLAVGRWRFPVPLSLGVTSLLLPMLAAVVLGAVFSYWPARSAALITPSEALRND